MCTFLIPPAPPNKPLKSLEFFRGFSFGVEKMSTTIRTSASVIAALRHTRRFTWLFT